MTGSRMAQWLEPCCDTKKLWIFCSQPLLNLLCCVLTLHILLKNTVLLLWKHWFGLGEIMATL